MSWDPILTKILVKKVLVGLMNSARDPLSWTQTQLKKKISTRHTNLNANAVGNLDTAYS